MAASKRQLIVSIAISVAATSAIAGGPEISEADVLDAANKRFLGSIADLSATIESCSKTAEGRPAPVLKKSQLKNLQAERQELLVGLSHLSFHNMFQCERQARLAAAYAAGTLVQVMGEAKIDTADVKSVQQSMVHVPTEHIRYQLQYDQLKPDLRRYLEKTVGERPFDIIDTLEANGLMLE